MADPDSSFPYNNDPFGSPFSYHNYSNIMNDSNPTLANLSASNNPADSYNQFTGDLNNLLNDPMAWDSNNNLKIINNETAQFQEAGPSHSNDTMPLPFWPPDVAPFRCSCCHVLREIIHSDAAGNCAAKMEVHGRMGIICHAILEIKDRVNLVPFASQFHMIDFCGKSIDDVKQYLQQYCNDQQSGGLILVNDPLSMYYEALCVGLNWDQNGNNNNNQQPIFPGLGDQIIVAEGEEVREPKTNLAQQRERAGRMTLRDLEDYFHLPIEEAGRALNLCPTVVKKICRRFGMNRWPHRKIKSYRRQISNMRALLSSNDAGERSRALGEIHRLEAEIANTCTAGNYQLDYI